MDEDEGEEIVAGRGMAGMRSMLDVPLEGPPGPRPEDLAEKTEKHGLFRKGKESAGMNIEPQEKMKVTEPKKETRKERKKEKKMEKAERKREKKR